jgi:putative transposase
VLGDALGNPVRFILTPGQPADIPQAEALLADQQPAAVLADKGYDSDALLAFMADLDAQAVIPARRNRILQRELDDHFYAERNKVERLFNRLKHYRLLATRYDKTARNFLAFWHIAASMMLLL